MLRRAFPNTYEGWLVVGSAAFVMLLTSSIFFYGFGTIFNEVIAEFGWSYGATALAFSLRSEVGGIASPLVGIWLDRSGPGKLLILGAIITAIGIALMSMIQSLWQFYVVMFIIAIGTSGAGGQVGQSAAASWFRERRGRAMGLISMGGGVGGVLVIAVAWLVEEFGWRWALRVLALLMLTLGVAVATNVRGRPRHHHQPIDGIRRAVPVSVIAASGTASTGGLPDPSAGGSDALGENDDDDDAEHFWGIPVRRAVQTSAFFFLFIAVIASQIGGVAFVVHLIPYLELDLDVSTTVAGGAMALFTLVSIVGRLGLGYAADLYPKRYVMALSIGLVAAGLPILALATELWHAVLGILLIAPGFGGTVPVRPALLADYFGIRSFGTINGVTRLANTTGGAAGAWIVGVLVDVTGAYAFGWWIAAVITALGVPAILISKPPTALIEEYRAVARNG